MKALTQITSALLFVLLTFASCKKEQAEPQAQFDQAEINTDIREIMEEMELASQAIQSAQVQNKLFNPDCAQFLEFPECAKVEIAELPGIIDGPIITVDFGDGCEDNGELKTGIIVITIDGQPEEPGFSLVTEIKDYGFKGKIFNGSKVINNVSDEVGDQFGEHEVFQELIDMQYSTVKNNKSINSITQGELFIEWKEGINSDECNANVFAYSGSRTRTVKVGKWQELECGS